MEELDLVLWIILTSPHKYIDADFKEDKYKDNDADQEPSLQSNSRPLVSRQGAKIYAYRDQPTSRSSGGLQPRDGSKELIQNYHGAFQTRFPRVWY